MPIGDSTPKKRHASRRTNFKTVHTYVYMYIYIYLFQSFDRCPREYTHRFYVKSRLRGGSFDS